MQRSEQPYMELDRARQAVEEMRQAKSLEDFEESWKEYLRRLERTWNKSENHFRRSPKWDSWHGPFKALRRRDPLLAYLINARGADEHTVSEITERESAGVMIGRHGMPAHIHSLRTDSQGRISELIASPFTEIFFRPARVRLLPIVNRGVTYAVPEAHLNQRIDPNNLLDIAERGLSFYDDFLSQAEAFFIR